MDAVLLSSASADPLYRRCIRVSMGTVFQVPWARLAPGEDPDDGAAPGVRGLQDLGFRVAALELTDRAVPVDAPHLREVERLALVLGSEGPGVRQATLHACDDHVMIPMSAGVSSLNVAAAAAVAFWELRVRGV